MIRFNEVGEVTKIDSYFDLELREQCHIAIIGFTGSWFYDCNCELMESEEFQRRNVDHFVSEHLRDINGTLQGCPEWMKEHLNNMVDILNHRIKTNQI